jgi:ribosomal protein L11 methyltransferase
MAFGTGLHETTASCLEMLVDEMRPGMRVADIGCGSGILAIAAARLGAASVLATDVDPLAIAATRENIEANSVAGVVEVELEPGEVGIPQWERDARPGLSGARQTGAAHPDAHSGNASVPSESSAGSGTPNGATSGGFAARDKHSFDLVVANILAETLVEMRSSLTGAVCRGGFLVLSGIEARRLKMVEEAFIGSGWCCVRCVTKGDWVSLCLHFALAEPARGLSVPAGSSAVNRA